MFLERVNPRSAGVVTSRAAIALLIAFLAVTHARGGGPCDPQWLPGDCVPGTDGEVSALVYWDPDGSGPRRSNLVVAGTFAVAGGTRAANIAMWENGEWTALGAGANGPVFSLAVMPDGSLVAGGRFTQAGGADASNIARWDGATWTALGSGVGGPSPNVKALAVMPDGDLVAAGTFTSAGGVSTGGVARWDSAGGGWSALGAGGLNVQALAVMNNGDLVASGDFRVATGEAGALYIARWNGAAWFAMGSGTNGQVYALKVLPSGHLLAGGSFSRAGGIVAHSTARWNPSASVAAWSAMGGMPGDLVLALAVMPNGQPVAGGYTPLRGRAARFVSRWENPPGTWRGIGDGLNDFVRALTVSPQGDLIVGGIFTDTAGAEGAGGAGGIALRTLARWNGVQWSGFGTGTNGPVRSLLILPDGQAIAGGDFTVIGGVAARHIARRVGGFGGAGTWQPLGGGIGDLDDLPVTVYALTALPGGDIVAGGDFTLADATGAQVPVNVIARWDGKAWHALDQGLTGGGPYSYVAAMVLMPDDDLVVAGAFSGAGQVAASKFARWDGKAWAALSDAFVNNNANALALMPNGDLVAGGWFTDISGLPANHIARWNGLEWSVLGEGVGDGFVSVQALKVLATGDLIAGGSFTSAGKAATSRIARWDGSEWSGLGQGVSADVGALAILADGSLGVGGAFSSAGGATARGAARWDGLAWSALGAGLSGRHNEAAALAVLPNGDLIAGGDFALAGEQISAFWARWGTPEPPVILTNPAMQAGCVGRELVLAITVVGCGGVTYRWQKEQGGAWVDMADSPPRVLGVAGPVLTIARVIGTDAGVYRCVVSNPCASSSSASAPVGICAADFDCSGEVSEQDVFDFLGAWFARQPGADVNGDARVSVQDLIDFVIAWLARC